MGYAYKMKKVYLTVLGILVLLVVIGTFADLSIAEAVFNRESAFGEFFVIIGMIPNWTLTATASGLLLGVYIKKFGTLDIIWRLICPALVLFGIYAAYQRTTALKGSRHLQGLPYPALVLIVVSCFVLAAVLGFYASRKYARAVIIAGVVGVVAVGGGRLLLDFVKNTWGRQRFYTMDNPAVQFTGWYQPQFPNAERIKEMADKIKSFPSAHSFGGISVLWLSMFPAFLGFCQKSIKKYSDGIVIFTICLWACVALSRLLLGEHFLSDVAISAIVFIVTFIVINWVAEKFIKVENAIETNQ